MNRSTPRTPGRGPVVIAFALVMLAVVGCGGDTGRGDDTSGSSTTQPTSTPGPSEQLNRTPATANVTDPARKAYIAKVDQVCSRLDPERNKSQEEVGKSTDEAAAVKAYDDTVALGEQQYREIRAIPTPPGDGKLLRTNVFNVLERQLALRRQMATALATSDVSTLESLRAEHDTLTNSLLSFSRGYGFQVCGED